jgi:hypothetical protein
VQPLKTSHLQNHSFDFCVLHHAYASITAWLLKIQGFSAHNISGVRIPSFPHTNKIKKGMAVKTPGQMPFQQQD